jgi:hypothetical protein
MSHHNGAPRTPDRNASASATRTRLATVPSPVASAAPPLDGDDLDRVFDRLAELLQEAAPSVRGASLVPLSGSPRLELATVRPAAPPLPPAKKPPRPGTQNKILEPVVNRAFIAGLDLAEPPRSASNDVHHRVTLRAPRLPPEPRPWPASRTIRLAPPPLPTITSRPARPGPPPLPTLVAEQESARQSGAPAERRSGHGTSSTRPGAIVLYDGPPRSRSIRAPEIEVRAWSSGPGAERRAASRGARRTLFTALLAVAALGAAAFLAFHSGAPRAEQSAAIGAPAQQAPATPPRPTQVVLTPPPAIAPPVDPIVLATVAAQPSAAPASTTSAGAQPSATALAQIKSEATARPHAADARAHSAHPAEPAARKPPAPTPPAPPVAPPAAVTAASPSGRIL